MSRPSPRTSRSWPGKWSYGTGPKAGVGLEGIHGGRDGPVTGTSTNKRLVSFALTQIQDEVSPKSPVLPVATIVEKTFGILTSRYIMASGYLQWLAPNEALGRLEARGSGPRCALAASRLATAIWRSFSASRDFTWQAEDQLAMRFGENR